MSDVKVVILYDVGPKVGGFMTFDKMSLNDVQLDTSFGMEAIREVFCGETTNSAVYD